MCFTQSHVDDLQLRGRDYRRIRPGKGRIRQATDFGIFFLRGLCDGCFSVRPAKRFAGDPHLVHDYGKFPCYGNARLAHAATFGNTDAPRLKG